MIIDSAVSLEPAIPLAWGFTNASTGTPGFWIEFQFTKITADDGSIYTARKTWYITDKTIEFFLKDMDTLGWHGKDLKELETHDFRGPEVLISTEMQEYEGKLRAKITWINPLDYVPSNKPMDKTELNTLAAKMKGKLASYRAKNKAPVNGKSATVGSGSSVFPDAPSTKKYEIGD